MTGWDKEEDYERSIDQTAPSGLHEGGPHSRMRGPSCSPRDGRRVCHRGSYRGWVKYPGWIAFVLLLVTGVWYIFLSPALTYRYFSYDVREEEVEIHSGIFFRKYVLVPMTRVQHVEKASGPVLRKFDLAQISIVTAATTHEIRG